MTTEAYPGELTDISTEHTADESTNSKTPKINVVIYLSAVKIIIGTVGVIGNMVVLVVLMKLQSQKVKFLIGTQAAIDMITSVALVADAFTKLYPPTVSKNPKLGYLYCLFWRYEMLLFVFFALSTYNLVAISIERYILVMNPLRYRAYFSRNRAVLLGIVAWVLAPIMQVVYAITQETYRDGQCVFVPLPFLNIMGVLLFVSDFFIPCIIMGFCFTCICVKLYKQDKKAKALKGNVTSEISTVSSRVSTDAERKVETDKCRGSDNNREEEIKYGTGKVTAADETKRSRNVTKTFVIIFAVFIVCWSTNQFLFLQQNLGGYNHHGTPENHFANSMAILNSALNPFIYVLHMRQYREKLKSLCCG